MPNKFTEISGIPDYTVPLNIFYLTNGRKVLTKYTIILVFLDLKHAVLNVRLI